MVGALVSNLSRLVALMVMAVMLGGVTTLAQAPTPSAIDDPSTGSGNPEPATCEHQESVVQGGGAGRPSIASRTGTDTILLDGSRQDQVGTDRPGSAGCRAPVVRFKDPFTGRSNQLYVVEDGGEDGPLDILRTLWGEVDLSRAQARRLQQTKRVLVAGDRMKVLKAGRYHVVCVELATDPCPVTVSISPPTSWATPRAGSRLR